MGTRGLWGFVLGNDDFLTYNHFDSYPDGLGKKLVSQLKELDREWIVAQVKDLRLVDESDKASAADIEALRKFHDGNVSTGEETEWYSLLRNLHGELTQTLDAGVMIDSHEFANDSLFCEWAYVIDLNTNLLEIYQGFQEKPHNEGRFALNKLPDQGHELSYQSKVKCCKCNAVHGSSEWKKLCERAYFPIKLVGVIDLDNLDEANAEFERIEKEAYPEEEN